MFKYFRLLLLALVLTSCSQETEQNNATTPLIVKTSTDDVRFNVETATTPDQLKLGLMNRNSLAFNSGMIFNIYPVRPTAMWMKNTKIPLDMLFLGPDGTIIMIKENAQPMSEELIICRDPVRAVVELNAGQVKRHGIKVGDKVSHSILNNMLDTTVTGPEPEPQKLPEAKPAAAQPKTADVKAADLPDPGALDSASSEPENHQKAQPEAPVAKPAAAPVKVPAPAPKIPVPAPAM